ncbi:MAG: P-loop NTPase [Erythrobacter sp.]|nr:P-loop NTPase [Erythrobacter sp.]
MDSILNLTNAMGVSVPAESYILSSAHHIEHLKVNSNNALDGINLVAIEASAPVPEDVLANARILVLEVDPSSPASLARMSSVRSRCPELTLVAAIHNPDFSLVRTLLRQGLENVVELPFNADDVLSELIDIHARQSSSESDLSPMIGVIGATGGVGASSVLTHLSAALIANEPDASCCLIDLDLQSGQSTYLLNVAPTVTVQDLLEASERLDEDMLRDAMIESESGIAVLGAPATIGPLEDVNVDRLLRLLSVARSVYDYVVLDLPANWTNWSLSIVCACQSIALVTDQSLSGLRGAKRTLELFDSVDIDPQAIGLVLNKVERRLFQAIDSSDVANTLNKEIWGELALDKEALRIAQENCSLVWSESRRNQFGKDIVELAAEIQERAAGGNK